MNSSSPSRSPERLAVHLRQQLSDAAVVRVREPLGTRTTLGVGGPVDLLVEPDSEGDVGVTLRFCAAAGLPWRVLGRGSNLLVRDGGYRGVILALCRPAFSAIEVNGCQIHCGAGARLKAVAGAARRAGLAGLEFLEGIPGSVGGALRMNAGAHGGWMAAVVERIRYLDPTGVPGELTPADAPADYRRWTFLADKVAVAGVLRGDPEPVEAITARMDEFSRRRRATQPREPSAGCIFKNPPGIPAGRLIQELGLKGTRLGGAEVSCVHGNFLVNRGEATAADVLGLIELVRQRAAGAGITLETEVEILGEETPAACSLTAT